MSEGTLYVVLADNRIEDATLISDRDRHRVLRISDGRAAKILKGSRHLDKSNKRDEDRRLRTSVLRNRLIWRYLRRKEHPGLLRVFERVVDANGDEGYLCEWLQSHDFAIGRNPLATNFETFLIGCEQLASATGALHNDGVVHGDLTPGNVCLRKGSPVLIDFELSVRSGQYSSEFPTMPELERFCYTPSCASPEQVRREPLYPQSDVYCLGITFMSWITGRFGVSGAWNGQAPTSSAAMCAKGEYPHWDTVERYLQPAHDVVEILKVASRRDPSKRYADGKEMADALRCARECLTKDVLERPIHTDRMPYSEILKMWQQTNSMFSTQPA